MKNVLICSMLLVLLLSGCAHTSKWDTTEKAMVGGALLVTGADYLQTRTIARNPDQFYETNPLIGHHPSQEKVATCFIISTAAAILIADLIDDHTWRKIWLGFWLGSETATVVNNERLGIRF